MLLCSRFLIIRVFSGAQGFVKLYGMDWDDNDIPTTWVIHSIYRTGS